MERSTGHAVLDAIRTRRSIAKMKPDPIPRALLEQWLDAAVWVANHRVTEPWTFYVLEGDAKRRFAELRREFQRMRLPNPNGPEAQPALDKVYASAAETPAIIVFVCRPSTDPELGEEDVWATYSAAYAVMLAAWDDGVGTYFRSGEFRSYGPLREFLGLAPDERIIGMLHVGYPAEVPQKRRAPGASKTVWLTAAERNADASAGSHQPRA